MATAAACYRYSHNLCELAHLFTITLPKGGSTGLAPFMGLEFIHDNYVLIILHFLVKLLKSF